MDQQTRPSASRRLLDLPASCLHHIVCFMDQKTKRRFFRTSKGSQDAPGCAVLVLRASKLKCTYIVARDFNPAPACRSLLHWAAQISTDMELDIHDRVPGGFPLLDVLHSLMLHPDATYPGITTLELRSYKGTCLIPPLLADACPSLKSFKVCWAPDTSHLGPVLNRELPRIEHVEVSSRNWTVFTPAIVQHIAQQLSHMPSLTSLALDSFMLSAVSPALLANLPTLKISALAAPTAEDNAALAACSQLESLWVGGGAGWAGTWLQVLPLHAPSIRTLDAEMDITDVRVPPLLALPHLTSLTVYRLRSLSDNYSNAQCSWKHLKCSDECNSDIARLPLRTLESPITCRQFSIFMSDHAADLAAIRAARPHLVRCGGIRMENDMLHIEIRADSNYTKEQAAEVLAEWAPCLPVPPRITTPARCRPVVEDALARLWPVAWVKSRGL